ncbi:MAG: YrbL family protein [Roseibacillus sp.]|nr:YrbL family protein [Roseibacillus sp.]
MGYVYELVRDEGGEIARNFAHYLVETPEHRDDLMLPLAELGRYLLEQRIVTSDFRDHNILCPVDAGGEPQKLVIIDGVCDPSGFSISNWIKPLAQRRVRRRWARGMARLQQGYPQISDWPEL